MNSHLQVFFNNPQSSSWIEIHHLLEVAHTLSLAIIYNLDCPFPSPLPLTEEKTHTPSLSSAVTTVLTSTMHTLGSHVRWGLLCNKAVEHSTAQQGLDESRFYSSPPPTLHVTVSINLSEFLFPHLWSAATSQDLRGLVWKSDFFFLVSAIHQCWLDN